MQNADDTFDETHPMLATVEYRFGGDARRVPHTIEWLSDNGSCYTAYGESLGLLICTTPVYSPESKAMVEALMKAFKRDYVYLNRRETARCDNASCRRAQIHIADFFA